MESQGLPVPACGGTSHPIHDDAALLDGQARPRSGLRIGPRSATLGLLGSLGHRPGDKRIKNKIKIM